MGVINGTLAGMLTWFVWSLPIYAGVGAGVAIFTISVLLHHRHQLKKFAEVGTRMATLFPPTNTSGAHSSEGES